MTEYKKLCTLVLELKEEVSLLNLAFKTGDTTDPIALHTRSMLIQSLIINGRPRLVKILNKALETDPNRQIYNETMCESIKKLFEDFCEVVDLLFTDSKKDIILSEENFIFEESLSILWVSDIYDQYMIKLAHTEEWKKRLATSITELLLFEEESRIVISAKEKQIRNTLFQNKQIHKGEIQKLLKKKEIEKWEFELRRRSNEHQNLISSITIFNPQNIYTLLQNIPLSLNKILATNMLQLIRALRTTPEDPNIRRIRCNNIRVMMEYGHVALSSKCQICQNFVSFSEILWYMMRYQVEYSSSPVQSLRVMIESNPEIKMPCGLDASTHVITEIGFEDYSERFFSLHEPNPIQESTEWMTWYTTLEDLSYTLENFIG